MKKKLSTLLKNPRIIILIVAIVLAVWGISPHPFNTGAAIQSVVKNSAAFDAGMETPASGTAPTALERITAVDNTPIHNALDFYNATRDLKPNQTVYIQTNKKEYLLTVRPQYNITVLPELINVTVPKNVTVNETINGSTVLINKTINTTVTENKTIETYVGPESLGILVEDAAKTNIRYGLDLEGGTRVLLQPETPLPLDQMEIVRSSMEQRLNVYGLSNVVPTIVYNRPQALGGTPMYISVEIAGANVQQVRDLLAKQGKFEAKIGNVTVFSGGTDVKYVCRSPECSGLDPKNPPQLGANGQWQAGFWFTITISPEAAKRQAEITRGLSVVTTDSSGNAVPSDQQYLNETIDLFLDNQKIDSLYISRGLQGNPVTQIQISGTGTGTNRDQAIQAALDQMKKLQTVLITGSLPVKMNIVRAENVSPILGHEFAQNAFKVGLIAIFVVILVVVFLYRNIKLSIPMSITMLSEVLLLFGLAAFLKWDLDLSAIAGIIIAVGTGVDDQIVIADEVLHGTGSVEAISFGERIKRAFFIVMTSYLSTVVAMLPLLFAGAGLLKGFALTTIAGVSFGVFITRQAFAAMVEYLLKD